MTMMSSELPAPWEVWHARFNFDGKRGEKYRPVIVIGVRDNGSHVMMVTSATNKLKLEHDYPLRDWRDAGLDKPPIARADRIAEIPPSYVGAVGRIGRLSVRDEMAFKELPTSMTAEERGWLFASATRLDLASSLSARLADQLEADDARNEARDEQELCP